MLHRFRELLQEEALLRPSRDAVPMGFVFIPVASTPSTCLDMVYRMAWEQAQASVNHKLLASEYVRRK